MLPAEWLINHTLISPVLDVDESLLPGLEMAVFQPELPIIHGTRGQGSSLESLFIYFFKSVRLEFFGLQFATP